MKDAIAWYLTLQPFKCEVVYGSQAQMEVVDYLFTWKKSQLQARQLPSRAVRVCGSEGLIEHWLGSERTQVEPAGNR